VVFETHAPVELDGGVAAIHFQVDDSDSELAGLFGEEFEPCAPIPWPRFITI
jgi:hypothetical protein